MNIYLDDLRSPSSRLLLSEFYLPKITAVLPALLLVRRYSPSIPHGSSAVDER